MADAPGIPGRHVILPWAPVQAPMQAAEAVAQKRIQEEPHDMVVAADGMMVTTDRLGGDGAPPNAAAFARRALSPELQGLGLPAEPAPTIPEEDRPDLSDFEEDVVSLAVALDILATMTRVMAVDPTILQRLTRAALHVGELGGLGEATVESLLTYAGTDVARARAQLTRALGSCMSEAAATPEETEAVPSTPESVARALQQVEAAAELTVREAILLLQAHEPFDYWLA